MRNLRRALWTATAAWWLFLFIVTHVPARKLPEVGGGDKLHHFLGYAALGLLLSMSVAATFQRTFVALALAVLAIMAYGAIDEWLQILVNRDCELNDWIADCAGAIAAVALVALVVQLRKKANPRSGIAVSGESR